MHNEAGLVAPCRRDRLSSKSTARGPITEVCLRGARKHVNQESRGSEDLGGGVARSAPSALLHVAQVRPRLGSKLAWCRPLFGTELDQIGCQLVRCWSLWAESHNVGPDSAKLGRFRPNLCLTSTICCRGPPNIDDFAEPRPISIGFGPRSFNLCWFQLTRSKKCIAAGGNCRRLDIRSLVVSSWRPRLVMFCW